MVKRILFSIVVITCQGLALASDAPPKLVFYTEDYPPFSYTRDTRMTGINTELLRNVAREINLDVTFMEVPWARAQAWTQERDNACFFSAARTEARESIYQWAGPLSIERITLFSANESISPLASISEAEAYSIGGRSLDFYTQFVQQQGLEVDVVSESGLNLEKLSRGRIDLWIAGSIGGPYIAAQFGASIFPVVSSEESFPLWLACNLGVASDLVRKIDQSIESIRNSDFLENMMQNYR
ncbi:transporter substrate-binding domain-containing protein [Salinispirillum sp. LH 10-3-1]|uniref:Transporter substrate-binding domain-containing protein n=1 Tax=Salinispirillum sp. LH 10-3-1 TaxID=2952525 RepID=A0AB38YJL3_9GAMM